jgi:hypothetical protein
MVDVESRRRVPMTPLAIVVRSPSICLRLAPSRSTKAIAFLAQRVYHAATSQPRVGVIVATLPMLPRHRHHHNETSPGSIRSISAQDHDKLSGRHCASRASARRSRLGRGGEIPRSARNDRSLSLWRNTTGTPRYYLWGWRWQRRWS